MKVKMQTVDVRRSELTTIRVTVPAWELPVLQALHGATKVTPVSESLVEAQTPDADTEYQRLSGRYGRERLPDGSLGGVIAESVFGQFQPGIMNLQRSIDAAIAA